MRKQLRYEPRERIAIPVEIGGGHSAMTRDLSPIGMYLEMAGEHDVSGPVIFRMHLSGSKVAFVTEGTIVRVDHRAGDTGIAVKFLNPRLKPLV